jgi:hypothetical protein
LTASTTITPDKAGISLEPMLSIAGAAERMALLVDGGKYNACAQEMTENWLSLSRAESWGRE